MVRKNQKSLPVKSILLAAVFIAVFPLLGLIPLVNNWVPESQQLKAQSSNADVSLIFRQIAEINDRSTIRLFIEDFFIPEEPDEVTKLEVIDVTNNGFGPDDILVVYPSMRVYAIDQPTPRVQSIMRSWTFDEQQRDAVNLEPDYFYPHGADTLDLRFITRDEMIDLVQNSIIADLLESLNRNYRSLPISLRLERDSEGFTFQMWDFDRNGFSFTPRPPGVPDSVAVHDMLYVMRTDSTIVADTTYYDIIYINKTIEEIQYLPGMPQRTESLRGGNERNLPGSAQNRNSDFIGPNRPGMTQTVFVPDRK